MRCTRYQWYYDTANLWCLIRWKIIIYDASWCLCNLRFFNKNINIWHQNIDNVSQEEVTQYIPISIFSGCWGELVIKIHSINHDYSILRLSLASHSPSHLPLNSPGLSFLALKPSNWKLNKKKRLLTSDYFILYINWLTSMLM